MMSTATKLSKFGLPLMEETRDRLIKIYKDNPWLTSKMSAFKAFNTKESQ